jgi:hypothetical protein
MHKPTGLMVLARAFAEAGWDDIETTVGGTADAGAQPVFRNIQPGLRILDVVYYPMLNILVTPQTRGLVEGDLLVVLSITPHAFGWKGDPERVRTYLVRFRRERDDTYHLVEVHRDALLDVRRPL